MDTRNTLYQGGLPGPVVTQESYNFTFIDLPIDGVDRGQSAKPFCQIADGENGLGHFRSPLRTLPTIRSRDWSISTAAITTVPTTMNCQNAWTLSITRPVVRTAI